MLRLTFGTVAVLLCATLVVADDTKSPAPAKPTPRAGEAKPQAAPPETAKPETAPLPKRLNLFPDGYVIRDLPPDPTTREVWQYYAVDHAGRYVPRVILAPHTSYYLYNGRPYPWTTTRPNLHMPYALD